MKLSETQKCYLAAACAGFRPYGRIADSLHRLGLVESPLNDDGEPAGGNIEEVTEKGFEIANELGLDWNPGEPPEPNAEQLAEIERRKAYAAKCRAEKEASFQRCDTDGFLSQWANGLTARKEEAEAEILENGGHALIAVLVDRETGERVEAWENEGEFAPYFTLKNDADVRRYHHKFFPRNPTGRKLWNAGLRMVKVWLPAGAKLDGRGRGLSGACSVHVAIYERRTA